MNIKSTQESCITINNLIENPYRDIKETDYLCSNHTVNGFSLLTLNRSMDDLFQSMNHLDSIEVKESEKRVDINKLVDMIYREIENDLLSIHFDTIAVKLFQQFKFYYDYKKSVFENIHYVYYNTEGFSTRRIKSRILNHEIESIYDFIENLNSSMPRIFYKSLIITIRNSINCI